MAEALLKRNPDSAEAARDVSVSLIKLGDFLAQRGQPGDTQQALHDYARGLELAEALQKRNPDSGEAARDVSVGLINLGEFLAQRRQPGDAAQALRQYTRSLELNEVALERNPDSAQAARDVVVSLLKLGGFLAQRGQSGDAEQALRHYTRSLKLVEALQEQNPDSARAARDVSVSLKLLGDFLSERGHQGDAAQAMRHYTRSLEISEALQKRNPDSAEAARDVSVSLIKLGDFLAQRGQPGDTQQALRDYTRALELDETLQKQNPDSAQAARDVSVSLGRLGKFLAERGQPGDAAQALRHFTRNLELAEALQKQNPDSAQAARDVSVSLGRLGDFLAKRGQPGDAEQALRHYTRSLEICEALQKQNPDSAEAAGHVSISLDNLGDFLTQRRKPGDGEQALRHYTRSLEIREALQKRNPNAAQAARAVSVSLNRLGSFLAQRGQPGDAEQALRHDTRCLELNKALQKQNPDFPQAARDVSVSLNKLGDVLAQRGQPGDADQALQYYSRDLGISEALRKWNPDSAEAARGVMVSQSKLGVLDLKLQRFESAIAHFEAGIALLNGMIAKRLNEDKAAREKGILEEGLRFCQRALLATGDWEALIKADPKLLPELLSFRITELAKQGRLADVAHAGAKLRELEPKAGGNLYDAACAYGLCAGLAVKGKPAPTPAEEAERKKFVELSLACLKEAIAAGYHNFDHMRQDTDLAPLRGLPGFEDLFPAPTGK